MSVCSQTYIPPELSGMPDALGYLVHYDPGVSEDKSHRAEYRQPLHNFVPPT